jgi:hypothetical protein
VGGWRRAAGAVGVVTFRVPLSAFRIRLTPPAERVRIVRLVTVARVVAFTDGGGSNESGESRGFDLED